MKRLIDILVSSILLIALAPVLAIVALGILVNLGSPVLFSQYRPGLKGNAFLLVKFRTMADTKNVDGELLPDEERLTRLGQVLRKTSLDELPTLWNVLKGDMTLVGPRPLPVDEAAKCQNWEQRRLDVTPGLTCIWQAAGRRDRISFSDWMRMDLRYIKARSIRKDLALLWRTFVNVIFHRASH